ncbi:probable membrane-associated kinase regulator 6 [Solanum pennellii]|uniref:Probable membrane-associated kinase regulator 6 n=1 Tax=Solanum pennellii TaxID=28526 RepID=A0ABM1UY01_SOLPN|nr:probable membrane-associated kinase regulator 6 [Solanum pennellii]
MENTLKYLASESFSYSWLLNETTPSLESTILDDQDTTFLNFSKRFLELESQNFNFDINPTFSFVHADEIFSDGHIMPLYLDNMSKIEKICNFDTCSISSTPLTPFYATNRGKQRKSCGKILVKRLKFLWLFCKSLGNSRKGSKVDDFERKVLEIDSRNSPMRSPSHCIDMENTISEAILHCKRSFGMLNDICD